MPNDFATFHIVNFLTSINGMHNRKVKSYLHHNNSIFAGVNLLQTIKAAIGAPNSCSDADKTLPSIDNTVFDQKATCFNDLSNSEGTEMIVFHSEKINGEIQNVL